MRLIFFFSFIAFVISLRSQADNDHYRSLYSSHSIGLNGITKDSIYVEDISFVNNISDFVYDSINQVLLSYFALYSNEGSKTSLDYITSYSLREKKILWSRLVDRDRAKYQYVNDKFYLITDEHSGLIDILTDTFIWKTKSRIYTHPEMHNKNIVLAPLYKNRHNAKVCAALNAATGDTVWTNPNLELKMGIITEPHLIGDSFIFLNEHLHLLDINNGKYWKSEIKINKILDNSDIFWREFSSAMFTGVVGGVMLGAFNSRYLPVYHGSGVSPGLKSNAPLVLDDYNNIYVVGIKGMDRFDIHGRLINMISHNSVDNKSSILKVENQLYYSELGSYIQNNVKKNIFRSFFYLSKIDSNLETLSRLHLDGDHSFLSKELGHFHIETKVLNDTFYILFRNGLLVLDKDLKIAGKFTRTKKEDPEYRNLLLGNFYEYYDSAWLKRSYNEGYVYLERLDKSIDVINSKFQFVRNIPQKNIYKIYYQDDLISAVVNVDGKCFLLDKHDRTIIDMLRIEKVLKQNDHYYIANLNGYYIIKANQLVK